MSDKSENELFDFENDSPEKSPVREEEDQGDPEVPLRDEDPEQDRKSDPEGEGPAEGEDLDDAGYGGDDAIGEEELEEIRDDVGNYGEEEQDENIGEIEYTKDEPDYEEDFEYGSDTDIKRKKKSSKKEERSSRRKKVRRDDEAEEDPYAEEEEESGTKKKGRRNKADIVDENQLRALVDEMETAYENDIECFEQKRPAIFKLKLLPKVESILKRFIYQRALLEMRDGSGLEILRKWLSKTKRGPPPSLQIKKSLLDIILQLPVTDDNLKESKIGQVIYTMRNNPNEDPELKKTLKEIIDKWTRVITDTNDYNSLIEDYRDRKKIAVSLDDYRQQSMSSLRKSIPRMVNKRSGFDFVRRPQQEGGQRSMSGRQQATEECDKLIKEMKRKMKREIR